MWQYTTETIINSNKGNFPSDTDKVRVAWVASNGKPATGANDSDTLIIDGVGSFIKKYIANVYRADYVASVNDSATVTLKTAATAGEVLELNVTLTEEGRVSSIMQNALLTHSKPLHYEIVSTGVNAKDAEAFAKLINKDMALTDFDFFEASASEAVLTLKAKDCYTRFKEITLVKPEKAPVGSAGALLGYNNYVATDATVAITKGTLGQGTVAHPSKDLRIPTQSNLNPFGPDTGGKPVPGGEYVQYLIEYETPRCHVSPSVMGSVGEISRTSHVLFVEKTGAKAVMDLLDALVASGNKVSSITTAPTAPKQTPGSVQ